MSAQSSSEQILPAGTSSEMSLRMQVKSKPAMSREEIAKIIEENTTEKWKEKQRRDNTQRQAQIERNQRLIDSLTEDDIKAAEAEMDKIIEETEKERDFSRTKVHVDMDAFYASVEVRDDPKLRSQPVASTANYVARRFGVRSALAGYIAKKLCPQLVIVPCNFRKYISVSDVVMTVLRDYDPRLSCPSLDEAYMDLTDYLKNRVEPAVLERIRYSGRCICRLPLVSLGDMPGERATRYDESCLKCQNIRTVVRDYVTFGTDVQEVVREMRFRVQQSTGLTCSAGIASNSRLAKICSDMNKPNGQYYLEPTREAVINFMRELPARKVPGIGPVAEVTLKAMGIETCGQLVEKRGILWRVMYPMTARWYMEVALGIKIRTVDHESKTERTRKSIGTEQTFRPCSRVTELEEILDSICEELATSLPRHDILGGKTVVLKVKYDNFELHTRSRTLSDVVGEKDTMLAVVKKSLKEFVKNGEKVRLLGVSLSNLEFAREGRGGLGKRRQETLSQYLEKSPVKPKKEEPAVSSDDDGFLPEILDPPMLDSVTDSTVNDQKQEDKEDDSDSDIVDVTPGERPARRKLEFVKETRPKSKGRQSKLSSFIGQSTSTSKEAASADAEPKVKGGQLKLSSFVGQSPPTSKTAASADAEPKSKSRQSKLSSFVGQSPASSKTAASADADIVFEDGPLKDGMAECPLCKKRFDFETDRDKQTLNEHVDLCLNTSILDDLKTGSPMKRKTPLTPHNSARSSKSAKRSKIAKATTSASQETKTLNDYFGTPKPSN